MLAACECSGWFSGDMFLLLIFVMLNCSFNFCFLVMQGATSHHLGQNFSKMFEIMIEDLDKVFLAASVSFFSDL